MAGLPFLEGQPQSYEELHMTFNESKKQGSYVCMDGKVTGNFEGVQDSVKAVAGPALLARRSHAQT